MDASQRHVPHPASLVDPPFGGDPDRSPLTGWTRDTWRALADSTLLAVRPFASPGHARIALPGPASFSGPASDGLEAFARTFLLASFRLSADGDDDPHHLAEWYAEGLAAGSDPAHPHAWPTPARLPQARVECASIALALHESRRWIWDRLGEPVRERLAAWLGSISGAQVPDNNWVWFRAVTQAFLRSVGAPCHTPDIDDAVARTEQWYAGDGWYSDGVPGPGLRRNFDHYNGWALHFYPLWYCRISGENTDPGQADRYRDRLRRFLADAQYLVGADGTPLLHGRSLTYRYAMLAPFWAGAVFDATPLAPGLTRRLASGVVRHFVRHGCFDGDGLQPLGWHGAFPGIRQGYSGPGSPYWSSKGFAGLVLPADHPVWTAVEEPTALERADVSAALPVPGWLVSGTREDGVVRVVSHGGDHADPAGVEEDDEVYARHGYATHAAPVMSEAARRAPLDSHVALLTARGEPSHRRPVETVRVDGRVAVSRHRAHWPLGALPGRLALNPPPAQWRLGPWVTTASVLRGALEVRLARVDPDAPGSTSDTERGPWRLRIGGWALASEAPPEAYAAGSLVRARRPDGLTSLVVALRGLAESGTARDEDANPLGRHCATPWVATAGPVVPGEVYGAVVALSGARATEEAARSVALDVLPDERGTALCVRWPDGQVDPLRLDPPPSPGGEPH